ncbi:glycine-rich domain-containing protein [Sphingomonas sp. CJ20]
MSPEDAALMARIAALAIDAPGAALPFAVRLARENGWSRAYAERVDREYRRFLFLAATAPHAVTPSDAVDQAWHLHLAYTRSYWDDLCGSVLGRALHHGPTSGGEAEDRRYRAQYDATLDAYRRIFGADAPGDVWPPAARRFDAGFVRVDRNRNWIVPRALAAPLLGVPVLAGCGLLAANGGGGSALVGYGVLIAIAAIVVAVAYQMRDPARRRGGKDGGGCGTGGCSTGGEGNQSGHASHGGDGAQGCGSGCGGGGCGGD